MTRGPDGETPPGPPSASERLSFRRWTAADLPLAMSLWGDSDFMRLIDARGGLPQEAVLATLRRHEAYDREHGVQYWPVFRRGTDEHVGCCGLRPREGEAGVYELGYGVRTGYAGQGLASEAARAVVDHAFGPLGATGLFAGHHPDNAASRRVLQRLGFVHTHDEPYGPTGAIHPCYRLGHDDPGRQPAGTVRP